MLANNSGSTEDRSPHLTTTNTCCPKIKEFFQKLGVDSLIYPEMSCRQEIVSSIRMSLGTPMVGILRRRLDTDRHQNTRKSRDTGHPSPQNLGGPELPYHVVAIKRGSETLIPRGDDTIKLHDIVYFTTIRKYVPYIRKIAGKEDYADVRNVMIMGWKPNCRTHRPIRPGLHAGENRGQRLEPLQPSDRVA